MQTVKEQQHGPAFYDWTWRLVRDYFEHGAGVHLVKHMVDSYNDFVLVKLEQIVEGFNPVEVHSQFLPEHGAFKHHLALEIKNPTLTKPQLQEKDGSVRTMTPFDARCRNLTYAGSLVVDLHVICKTLDEGAGMYTTETRRFNRICIGKVPIMVHSRYCVLSSHGAPLMAGGECPQDLGGYFIINGNEKVVISQNRIAENKTFVFTSNKLTAYSHLAEVRSVTDGRFSVPKTTSLKLSSRPNTHGRYVRVSIHHLKHEIPLLVLFRALGIESDKEVARYVALGIDDEATRSLVLQNLMGSIDDASSCGVRTRQHALEYLVKYLHISGHPREFMADPTYKMRVLESVLEREMLPHVGNNPVHKAMYLAHMTQKLLLCWLGVRPLDDRDSYVNKRVDTPGVLIANLLRQYYGKMVKDLRNMVAGEIKDGAWKASNAFIDVINRVNVMKLVKASIIESGLKYGLSTGNWGMKSNKTKQGVAQVLNRMTYNATLSHLRRINTPIEKSGKLVQPRKLHNTQWGIICPCETPEGASVGLVSSLAMMAGITLNSSSATVRHALASLPIIPFEDDISIFERPACIRVIVNGDTMGVIAPHSDPSRDVYGALRLMKRDGRLSPFTAVSWHVLENELHLCTEAGRCIRPLFVASQLLTTADEGAAATSTTTTWQEALERGLIEYLDVDELGQTLIAPSLEKAVSSVMRQQQQPEQNHQYSHVEIHPSLMLGILAGGIPFSDHNQSPRNCYQAAMGKQAIGMHARSYQSRFDSVAHVLNYPQRPLVYTQTSRITGIDDMPNGINAVVAIMTYTGFNQEDSVILNRSAVERGMFVSTCYKTFKEMNSKNHASGEEEYFCKPDPARTRNMKPGNYGKLQTSGFVAENTFVETGDIIVGKCLPQRVNQAVSDKDTSLSLKNNESGFVDRNVCHDNGDGCNVAKVRLRQERHPTIGDKFCLPADAEVLTEDRGWVRIYAMRADDRVLQKADATLTTACYGPVQGMYAFSHSGEMMVVEGETVSGMTTLNHKMFLQPLREDAHDDDDKENREHGEEASTSRGRTTGGRLMEAWQLLSEPRGSHAFLKCATFDPAHRPEQDVRVGPLRGDAAIAFLAAYSRRGFMDVEAKSIVLFFTGVGVARETLVHTGLFRPWSGSTEHQHMHLCSTDPALWAWMLPRRDQADVLPTLLQLSMRQSRWFAEAFMDGCTHTPRLTQYQADQLQRIFVHGGLACDLIISNNSEEDDLKVRKKSSVVLRVASGANGTEEPLESSYELTVRNDFKGTVYCIEVPHHVFYVRMHGRPMWTGNSSRHAQKGTVGIMYRQEDMPYTSAGTTPDIIVNPHAIPSRMTIAQLMECLMGKACASHGTYGDATPFTGASVDDLADLLMAAGMERCGNEVMHDPRTGEQMACDIFIGPTYYQRLKHMVADKVHSRAKHGPVMSLTRQPAEGRARDGGLRLGEMEVEVHWAHGASQFLKERIMECSDNFRMHVCRKCGMMATAVNPEANMYSCKPCKNVTSFAEVRIPYACKLLFQEIQAMAIGTRLTVKGP